MPRGGVTLHSITVIRVRLGTERERQREGSCRRGGGEDIARQRQRMDNTDGRRLEGAVRDE